MAQQEIQTLLKAIDESVTTFISDLPAAERKIYAELLELTKGLKTDKLGRIKNNATNIRQLSRITKEVEKIVLSKPYLSKVKAFASSYNDIAKLNNLYFSSVAVEFTPKALLDEIKKVNIETTVDQLTRSGIGGSFSNDIKTVLKRNITSGGSYSELANSLRETIIGVEGEDGRLVKYAKQITTDAVNQYNAQYTKAITEDLGFEWFIYQGANLTTSRDFCKAMTKKRYFHVSEIPELLKGEVDGVSVPINPKTDLPYGMIEDTNEDNFQVNRGGYQCGHQIFPVSKAAVPQELVEEFT